MVVMENAPYPTVRHRGPPLLLLALVHLALFAGGILAVTAFAGGERYPSPFEDEGMARAFFAANDGAMRANGFFHFASAIPLGLFTATIVSRLRFLGVRAAGELIALFGGLSAALALMLSGICGWVLSDGAVVQSVAAARALQLLAFAFGGPVFVALFGLLVAGVSVTCGFRRLLPRWLLAFGLGIAVVAELSTLTLLVPALVYLIPIARVTGLLWLIATALKLPVTRAGEIQLEQRAAVAPPLEPAATVG
jgi:hypothetical protein